MRNDLTQLPLDERIRLVEEVWDSIAADQSALGLSKEQQSELDRRLVAYEQDGELGRPARDVIADIRKRI